MKGLYKVWLWFEHLFDFRWERKHTLIALGVSAGALVVAVFLIAYSSVMRSYNADVMESRRVVNANNAESKMDELRRDTFADEILSVDDEVLESVSKNPNDRAVEQYLTALALMHDESSVQVARNTIPWADENTKETVGVSDIDAYQSKQITGFRYAKTYGSKFETYIGLFDITATAQNGNELTSKIAVTLTLREGSAVSWTMSERNVK